MNLSLMWNTVCTTVILGRGIVCQYNYLCGFIEKLCRETKGTVVFINYNRRRVSEN